MALVSFLTPAITSYKSCIGLKFNFLKFSLKACSLFFCLDDITDPEWCFHSRTFRCGLLGIKIGVQPQWFKNGKKISATLIQVVDNHVIRYTPPDKLPKNAPYSVVHPSWRGKYGFQVVGALSTDPQWVSFVKIS